MAKYLAIVAYRCLVAGSSGKSLDIQVRWFEAHNEALVRALIAEEPIQSYKNSDGGTASWELAHVFAVEPFAPTKSGEEVVGFITEAQELTDLAREKVEVTPWPVSGLRKSRHGTRSCSTRTPICG